MRKQKQVVHFSRIEDLNDEIDVFFQRKWVLHDKIRSINNRKRYPNEYNEFLCCGFLLSILYLMVVMFIDFCKWIYFILRYQERVAFGEVNAKMQLKQIEDRLMQLKQIEDRLIFVNFILILIT